MKHLKKYKLFESRLDIDEFENYISDILLELEDEGLQVNISRTRKDIEDDTLQRKTIRTDIFIEISIYRPFGSPDRVIQTRPGSAGVKYPGKLFFWYEVKEAIIRLNDWYYEYSGNEFTPGIDGKTSSELAKMGIKYNSNSPFRMFTSGVEFGIGWHKPEDFDNFGDFISFVGLRIQIKF